MREGELTVGTRLPPEAQLAEQLGVSRGILREALTILEARGHLSRTPKGGTVITLSLIHISVACAREVLRARYPQGFP